MAKENSVESVQHTHKPGPLKQQNKSHKHGRHKTKGMLENISKGRVSVRLTNKKSSKSLGKINRRNQAKQQRANKREEILQQKRKIGKLESPPHAVCVVPLSASCDTDNVFENMCKSNDDIVVTATSKCRLLSSPHMKQWFSFYLPKYGDLYAILDAAKAADVVIFLMDANSVPNSFGEKCLSCVVAQGIPGCFHVVQGLKAIPPKKQSNIKKIFHKLVEQRFPKEKVHILDTPEDASQLLRLIANHHHKTVGYRDMRPHVTAHEVHYETTDCEKDCGTLRVTGYVKGRPLSANHLVHIPGFGNFQLVQIDSARDPSPWKNLRKNDRSMKLDDDTTIMDEDIKVLQKPDPAFQETLMGEVIPDPMEGEQTWPTEEELTEAEATEVKRIVKKVPKGTSEYQSAWILEEEDDGDDDHEQQSGDEKMEDELMEEIEEASGDESVAGEEFDEEEEEYETISVTTETQDSRYDEKYPDDDRTE